VSDPLAVIYQLEGGRQLELLIPPGATAAVVDAGILVMHEDETVTGIISVRPLKAQVATPDAGEVVPDALEADDEW
jgi:hypothetical protein